MQILKIGGYDAYAALLQKTLDELMNYTVGDNPQAMCGSRPRSYKLEQFYIKTDKYSGQLFHSGPAFCNCRLPNSHFLIDVRLDCLLPAEHRELSYTTALPAVPFPVTQVPGDEFGIRQYVLNESLPRQAGGSAAGGPDGRTVCAGPRFIKIKQLVHDCQGNIKSDVTCWPTAYGNHVLEQSPFVNEIFYDHNTNAIPVSICHCAWTPTQLAFLPAAEFDHVFLWTTARTLLQAQAWPAGPPGQRILEGIFWRDEATGHFIPIPAQSSQWNLKIESKQADRGKKDFKTLLKFDLRFPRIKKLEALARIKKLEALAKAQSRYIPERC